MTKKQFTKMESFTEDDFFDDCPICQAQREAMRRGHELTREELNEAFLKAKKMGAVAGGPLLNSDNSKS